MKLKRQPQLYLGIRGWCMLDSPCSETRYHATVASVYTALLLWKLWKFLGPFWITPWVLWDATGHDRALPAMRIWPSAKNWTTGWTLVAGRHCKWPAGYSFLQNPVLTAANDRQCMAGKFQSNVYMVTLPIMLWTQGSVALGPRATNHAFRCMMAKGTKLANQCKCMRQNKWMPHALSCWDQGQRRPRVETCFVTWSTNTPHPSCLVWHPKPSKM